MYSQRPSVFDIEKMSYWLSGKLVLTVKIFPIIIALYPEGLLSTSIKTCKNNVAKSATM